ncbi:MAG: sigma-54-dependent Fis family transcriptional regulator [Desulfovibrio sp.]|nr:MAG: sigma-54-dependent Fis family transcriptional regulator [Desulfovibrio sp.]
MAQRPLLLIVDDDAGHRTMLATLLADWGYDIRTADDGSTAIDAVKATPFDLVLMDVRMAVMDGLTALTHIKEHNPAIPVLIMTAYSSVESAVSALKTGAYDYLIKPLDTDALKLAMERALDHTRLAGENRRLKSELGSSMAGSGIPGNSPAMAALKDMVATVAPSEATVLITGESGTGKELVARTLHSLSPRSHKPLIAVNCAALTETLLESELFGHEKGAFTGADRRREGRFMQADKGTLFLDEIGEVSPAMQAKLLRALQEKEIQRVGGEKAFTVDVRILAATNRDLKARVDAGEFREDLYYRLNVVSIDVPPLRDRNGDTPLLAQLFLERFAEKNHKRLRGFTPQAMDTLLRHPWPGNVRELENAIERAVILASGEYVGETELPPGLGSTTPNQEPTASSAALTGRSLEDLERDAILATLDECGGNKSEAARRLGITRATLHKKLKSYGVDG